MTLRKWRAWEWGHPPVLRELADDETGYQKVKSDVNELHNVVQDLKKPGC
jgi:hypothetical protein